MDFGKITLRMKDTDDAKLEEVLGYTTLNITSAGQSAAADAAFLAHAGASICHITTNTYLETIITYEITADEVTGGE